MHGGREVKDCPYCGEEIEAVAIKCKHCHSMLIEKYVYSNCELENIPEDTAVSGEGNKATNAGETLYKTGRSLTSIGCFLTVFVTIPILLLLFLGGC